MLGGFKCSKNSLIALNIFYITVGILLIGLGTHWMTSNKVSSLPIIGGVVACGVFLLIVSIGGIYATLKHHQVYLFFYMVILFVLFIIQFSIACACLAVSNTTQQGIAKQGWSSVPFNVKDNVQHAFSCCGFTEEDRNLTSPTDSMAHPSCSKIVACCEPTESSCCEGVGDPKACKCNPCSSELESVISQAFRVTGGVSLFFSFTEFFGIWLTVRYRNQKNPFGGNPSAFL